MGCTPKGCRGATRENKESEEKIMEYKYNDFVGVAVMHGKKDIWSYVTFLDGVKLHQFLTAEKAANVLAGLRATTWTEKYMAKENKEIWRFTP